MIACIKTKSVGNYYSNSDSLDSVVACIKSQLPLTCWWYSDFGKKFTETIVFYDEEQVLLIASESDASPLEEM